MDFSESIAASDLKVSRSSHLIEFMKVCEYLRSMLFLELGEGRYIQKFKPNFLRNYFADLNQIFMKAFQVLYVLCFTRPRYQVSVYRTTGPLV